MRVLAGDIGGTNCRLSVVDIVDNNYRIQAEMTYASGEYESFYEVLINFINQYEVTLPLDAACLAVAGPVLDQQVKVTNLPWQIEQGRLCSILQTPRVEIVNDFTAVAYGLPLLTVQDLVDIQTSNINHSSTDAVIIGAGTGLGAIHLLRRDKLYLPLPSEAGHAGFAPANPLQTELLGWLQQSRDHVCLENVLSGSGLYNIYQFMKATQDIKENLNLAHKMTSADPAGLIAQYALEHKDELCLKTLDCFVDVYASAAADIALHYYPLAEVYIAGGIAPKLKPMIVSRRFTRAFNDKGLMSDNLKSLNIRLVLQEKVGLYGAMKRAVNL